MDFIALLEASYDLSVTGETAWLRGLLTHAEPMFGECLGLGALTLRYGPRTFRIESLIGTGPAELQEWGHRSNAAMPKPVADIMYRSGLVLASLSRDVFSRYPDWQGPVLSIAPNGLRDALGALSHTGDGRVVVLTGLYSRPVAPTRRQRALWPRVSAHVAAGLRLRRSLEGDANRCVEAVLSPSGDVLEAAGVIKGRPVRERLRAAVKRIDRARTNAGRRDPHQALSAWRALIHGRWSLVDRFDSDGKRFVVAVKNDPANLDPRGLHLRERQVAEYIGMGRSTEAIAYALGISGSAVGTYAVAAQRKLGLRSRAELASFFHPNGLRAQLFEATVLGEELLVGSVPLFDEALLKRLTGSEREVALLLLLGSTNADIALRRQTSVNTVANQVQSVFKKLGITSRVQLAARLLERELTPTGAAPGDGSAPGSAPE